MTQIVQRKEKDSVLQMILKSVQELTEIAFKFKSPNVQTKNVMVSKRWARYVPDKLSFIAVIEPATELWPQ